MTYREFRRKIGGTYLVQKYWPLHIRGMLTLTSCELPGSPPRICICCPPPVPFSSTLSAKCLYKVVEILPAPSEAMLSVRIVAGSACYTDVAGQVPLSDRRFLGRRSEKLSGTIGVFQATLYGSCRVCDSPMHNPGHPSVICSRAQKHSVCGLLHFPAQRSIRTGRY